MPRIERFTIQGFRSFGKEPQHLNLESALAVIWGPNSEGKTSLAEAFEFLFTGDIARRQLLASALDEFADALCNAHLPSGTPTFVEANIVADDGSKHTLRRTVLCDFTKKRDCESTLALDGNAATPASLAAIGIALSEPPLSAPVLMQHTLAYLFTAKPQERSLYFKSLLEVTDLDQVRTSLRELSDGMRAPDSEHLVRLEACRGIGAIAPSLTPLLAAIPTVTRVRQAVAAAAKTLLVETGKEPEPDVDSRLAQLDAAVADRRAETFPLDGFRRGSAEQLDWSPPSESVWSDLDAYVEKLSEVDDETRRLVNLFNQVLALPDVAGATDPLDCPVCESPRALTPARIEALRARVAATAGLRAAEQKAAAALRTLEASAQGLLTAFDGVLPRFLTWTREERRACGFRTNRLAPLLEEAERPLLVPWFQATRSLLRARGSLARATAAARSAISKLQANVTAIADEDPLRAAFDALSRAKTAAADAVPTYAAAAGPIAGPLTRAVDIKSDTTGWADLAALGRHPAELRAALIERKAHAELGRELSAAARRVDAGREAVLQDKFDELAGDVATWWELLRPEESAFFSGLGLRKGAQRNIDFKAGLASTPERKDVKIRDAIAVFSQSQLHCLGLATFFARVASGGGFLVLDDPIIAIDDDYSAHFINATLEELRKRQVQVIMLTYEQKTFRAIQARHGDSQCEAFHLNLDDPSTGTVVVKTSDALSMMLKAAEPFTRSSVLATRKGGCQRIRDACERFCKDLLVRKRQEAGDATALITDYRGAKGTLDYLIPEVIPYLAGSDEPGKLRLLQQQSNPGNHDDDVPAKAALRVDLGNLRALQKKYL